MADPDMANYLGSLAIADDRGRTAFDEQMMVGSQVQVANSTTHPPNARWTFIVDNDVQTPDEFDAEVSHEPPLYRMTQPADSEYVIRTRPRMSYYPGHEAVCGSSFVVNDDVPEGQFVPDGVTIESGYAGLVTGTLTGSSLETAQGVKDKDGAVLHVEPDGADLRIYKEGAVKTRLPHAEWETDPFTDDRFSYDSATFALVRAEFDLYGAGDVTFFMRIRDREGDAHTLELGTVGITDLPTLSVFDLPVSTRVDTDGSAVDWSCGPCFFANLATTDPPTRTKEHYMNDPPISAAEGDAQGSVIAVYRQRPEAVEVATFMNKIEVTAGSGDCRVESRAIHPDYLTWPVGFDPQVDSNWVVPDNAHARNSAVEVADTASDTITIDTFTDTDGKTKMRGTQNAVSTTNRKAGQGGSTKNVSVFSELEYIALIGRGSSPAELEVVFESRW